MNPFRSLILLLAALALTAVIPAARAAEPAEAAAPAVELTDDDGGAALFAGTGPWRPGESQERCIELRYEGSQPEVQVSLFTEVEGTGLEEFLQVTVEVGEGGRFGDCSGFSPTERVFSGSLAELAARSGQPSTTLRDGEEVTYRFTVTLRDDDRAQGTTASADFLWEAVSP